MDSGHTIDVIVISDDKLAMNNISVAQPSVSTHSIVSLQNWASTLSNDVSVCPLCYGICADLTKFTRTLQFQFLNTRSEEAE